MKALRLFLFVAVSGMVLFSCGTAASSVGQGNVAGTASQSLADVLRKNSSLIIRGSGESAKKRNKILIPDTDIRLISRYYCYF